MTEAVKPSASRAVVTAATRVPGAARWVALVFVALWAWRSWQVLHTGAGLHVDEAQYWYWAQNLQWGYFSKPPVLVALIKLSTALFGNGLLGVKLLAMLCWLGASVLLWRLGADMGRERAGLVAAALLAASPASGLLGLAVTTDAPLVLLWTLVMWTAWRAAHAPGRAVWGWWSAAGLALGVAVLSKYTALILSLSALGLIACAPAGQRGRLWRGVLVAAVVAVGVVLPHLWWNQQNGWPTWKHTVDITLHAGVAAEAARTGFAGPVVHGLRSVLEFSLGQLLLLGPAALAVGVWALRRRGAVAVPAPQQPGPLWTPLVFAANFVVPLLLVGLLQAARAKAQVNWSLPALLGVMLCLGLAAERARLSWRGVALWSVLGVLLSGALALGGDVRAWVGRAPERVQGQLPWDIWWRMRGWHEVLNTLEPALQAHRHRTWVLLDRTQLVQVAYELRDLQPRLTVWNPDGLVRHHFDWKQSFQLQAVPEDGAVIYIGPVPPPAGLNQALPHSRLLGEAQHEPVALQAWLLARTAAGLNTP